MKKSGHRIRTRKVRLLDAVDVPSGVVHMVRFDADCAKQPFGSRPFAYGIGSAFDLYGIQFGKASKWWLGRTASDGFFCDREALRGDSVKAYYKYIGRTKRYSADELSRILREGGAADKLESDTDPRSKV
jgi:hypothetical protein